MLPGQVRIRDRTWKKVMCFRAGGEDGEVGLADAGMQAGSKRASERIKTLQGIDAAHAES